MRVSPFACGPTRMISGGRVAPALFDRVLAELFGSGEQGIYMPSVHESFLRGDLYQGVAGAAPVTAAGQSVGLWLDRSQGGRGPELVTNGNFASAGDAWILGSQWSVVAGQASRLASGGYIEQDVPVTAGALYEIAVTITAIDGSGNLRIRLGDAVDQYNASIPLGRATFRLRCGNDTTNVSVGGSSTAAFSLSEISIREIPGNHASQATAAARPKLQQDANGIYVLRFDGTDDWLVTTSIDFTGTDKMTVLAGAYKESDVSRAAIVDLGDGLTNAFYLNAPNNSGGSQSYGLAAGTTIVSAITVAGHEAPDLAVLRGTADIATSGDGIRLWRNRAVAGAGITQSTGKFGNYPLSIGARPSGLRFKGDIYGLIVCGAQKSLAQIEQAEDLINKYARAY